TTHFRLIHTVSQRNDVVVPLLRRQEFAFGAVERPKVTHLVVIDGNPNIAIRSGDVGYAAEESTLLVEHCFRFLTLRNRNAERRGCKRAIHLTLPLARFDALANMLFELGRRQTLERILFIPL